MSEPKVTFGKLPDLEMPLIAPSEAEKAYTRWAEKESVPEWDDLDPHDQARWERTVQPWFNHWEWAATHLWYLLEAIDQAQESLTEEQWVSYVKKTVRARNVLKQSETEMGKLELADEYIP